MALFKRAKKEESNEVVVEPAQATKAASVRRAKSTSTDAVVPSAKVDAKGKDAKTKTDASDTKDAYRQLLHPVVSERAATLSTHGQYVFAVPVSANKVEVGKAVYHVYGVRPVRVNIMNVSGNWVRFGRAYGLTKSWKKAIVTLPKGKSIEIYEGV